MTKKQYNDKVADLGCIVCRREMGVYTPALIHHVRRLATSKKRDHAPVIGLCPFHHDGYGFGNSIHAGRKGWEHFHGEELMLVEEVEKLLNQELNK